MDGWNLFALLTVGAAGALIFLRQFALEIGRIERRVRAAEAWRHRRMAERAESAQPVEVIATVSPDPRSAEFG